MLTGVAWGAMGVVEATAGQYRMHSALLIKYLLYGLTGAAFVMWLKGGDYLREEVVDFYRTRPDLLAMLCASVVLGLFGTYFAFCSYHSSGNNRGMSVVLCYCLPVIVIAALSYIFLRERYNGYAVTGVACILVGVYIIDRFGVTPIRASSTT